MSDLQKRARIALSVGKSLLTASMIWIMNNLGKLIYGNIEPYESFIPFSIGVFGIFLILLFSIEH